jgi:protein Mpv17
MPAPIILQKFAKFYNGNFDARPVPTLMVTNGILNGIADMVAQSSQILLSRRQPPLHLPHPSSDSYPEFQPPPPAGWDTARTARFVAFGVAMGPLIGVWMRFLERNIPLAGGSRRRGLQLGKRVAADQFFL